MIIIGDKQIMKINFLQFPVYDGIRKEKLIAHDVREALGNGIYMNIPGLRAHLLSEKIFKSTTEGVELDDEDLYILKSAAELFSGVFADSITDFLNKKGKEVQNED